MGDNEARGIVYPPDVSNLQWTDVLRLLVSEYREPLDRVISIGHWYDFVDGHRDFRPFMAVTVGDLHAWHAAEPTVVGDCPDGVHRGDQCGTVNVNVLTEAD